MDAESDVIRVYANVIEDISRLLGGTPYETGGLIGSSDNDVIDSFCFIEGRESSTKEYIPNVELMQQNILKWDEQSIHFRGIIHSHLDNQHLSVKDIEMARKIININSLRRILLPVFVVKGQRLIWYEVGVDNVLCKDSKII